MQSCKVPFKYRELINKLPNNSNRILLRQDKRRGIIVKDQKKYTKKMHGYVKH